MHIGYISHANIVTYHVARADFNCDGVGYSKQLATVVFSSV